MATWQGWERDVLSALGVPVTQQNTSFLDSWANAEGGSASFNPMNTTQPATGSTNYNSVGVKNYPDAATGTAATVKTLTNGYYPDIVAALQSGNPFNKITDALKSQLNTWGTGSSWLSGNPTSGATGSSPWNNAGNVFGQVFGNIGKSLPFPFSLFVNPSNPFSAFGAQTGVKNPFNLSSLIPLSIGALVFVIGISIVLSDNKDTIVSVASKIPME